MIPSNNKQVFVRFFWPNRWFKKFLFEPLLFSRRDFFLVKLGQDLRHLRHFFVGNKKKPVCVFFFSGQNTERSFF